MGPVSTWMGDRLVYLFCRSFFISPRQERDGTRYGTAIKSSPIKTNDGIVLFNWTRYTSSILLFSVEVWFCWEVSCKAVNHCNFSNQFLQERWGRWGQVLASKVVMDPNWEKLLLESVTESYSIGAIGKRQVFFTSTLSPPLLQDAKIIWAATIKKVF